jgi:hypothetical protein
MATNNCCAECGEEGGVVSRLKACKSCMSVKYCNAECQKKHWPTHKAACKLQAAKIRDEAGDPYGHPSHEVTSLRIFGSRKSWAHCWNGLDE